MGIRLNKVIKEFGVGLNSLVEFLHKKGFDVEADLSTKIDSAAYDVLKKEFGADKDLRNEAERLIQDRQNKEKKETISIEKHKQEKILIKTEIPEDIRPKFKPVGRINLDAPSINPTPEKEEKASGQEKAVNAEAQKPSEAKAESKPASDAEIKESSEKKEAQPTVQTQAEETPQEKKEQKSAPKEATAASAPASELSEESNKESGKPDLKTRTAAVGEDENGVFKLHNQVELSAPKVLGTIDLSSLNQTMRPKKKSKEERRKEREEKHQNGNAAAAANDGQKKKRNRINNKERVDVVAVGRDENNQRNGNNQPRRNNNNNAQPNNNNDGNRKNRKNRKASAPLKNDISDEDVAKQVKETLARLTTKAKTQKSARYRKEKRENARQNMEEQLQEERAESKVLKLTEFVTANELANMMDVPVTQVIGTCMSIGIMVSINQRMDAETINLVAEEFGFKTEYVSAEVSEAVNEEEDNEEDLQPRAPIVTVMGHVDHGKTSLLDYVRKSNVIAGEAGGITQHIGAYNVTLEDGRQITFLDTPGHEAFTAMRARGAQVTDVAIIIIAADDDIMPQTKEAINHAVAANVPIVFAINKIDKPGANPDKIKEGLAAMNFLVEEWGGKYQSQDISAKKGIGVKELLEKVLLEAEMLELKANPNRKATGTIIESALDKGRGYVATVLVSNGTLHVGDIVLAGTNYGRVKALFNERNQRIDNVGPARAATLLGFNGAPQAGDTFHVMDTEQEVREIANKREQLAREQGLRTQKMLTLDEVGRRIAQGGFKELNIIVKGDVDGSVEALSDSLIKLSTEKIAVNVIHKGVGQISENDVTLASASEAVIIGFQVRPSASARKMAEKQGVDIRLYSIIYDAIEEVKDAMEGMLEPVVKEEVTSTIEVREVYHISKVGYVAGAYVMDGKVSRSDKARLIRDGIVIFTGEINALKRFKDDVKEVSTNFECGISLSNCNDIKQGDIIETFKEVQIKAKL